MQREGRIAGVEVAQAYLQVPDGHGEPIRKLIGFEKVRLRATFEIHPRPAPRFGTSGVPYLYRA
ncbi:fibronectin type III-like domain-contianing protein [Microbacterium sp.]|uniref:fibronectin type III-like domain-contianing protein n=1 Tax=Microbacterium sp. TaxID=51671 RepID=UPI0039E2B405